jgi:hypothetical protein
MGTPIRSADINKALSKLIRNDNRLGNWFVTVYANKNMVNCFQCRTPEAAAQAANLIKRERAAQGLPTARATREELVRIIPRRKRSREFGPAVEIQLD